MDSAEQLKRKTLKLLQAIEPFPQRKDTRKDARPIGKEAFVGFCLGKVKKLDAGIVQSRFNSRFPELYRTARQLMHVHDPKFKYTSIQINKNMACAPHRDAHNMGPSYGIGLGRYTGGELVVDGQKFKLRNKFVKFDGRLLHHVEPFKGERYTLIYFTLKKPSPPPRQK